MSALPIPAEKSDEIVPLDQFMRMDFDERVELVNGKIVRMGWNNFTHATLINWIGRKIGNWEESKDWGFIAVGDAGVQIHAEDPATARGADILCISHERHAKVERKGVVIDVGPELIIEVTSPSNTWDHIQDKLNEYFSIGTDEVWVVSPPHKSVTVYHSTKESRTYTTEDAETVSPSRLEGFELPLVEMGKLIDRIETDSSK